MSRSMKANIFIGCFIGFVVVLYVGLSQIKIDECIISSPRQITSYYIDYPKHLFSDGPARYKVGYMGKSKLTDDVCTVFLHVAEDEYKRIAYGKNEIKSEHNCE